MMMHRWKVTIIILSLVMSGSALSQNVALKDTTGATISTHATIQAAYTAIVVPMTQAYVIEILQPYDGTGETFPITIAAKAGSSAANYILIRPAAGNTGEAIIGTSATPIFLFDDADYVILDGRPGSIGNAPDLKVQNQSTAGGGFTFRFLNGATFNTLKYINILNGTANVAGPRAIEFGTCTANPSGNSNNLVSHCIINGGRSGIGIAGSTANLNSENKIEYCDILNFGYAGVWMLSAARSTTVEYCNIYQETSSTSSLMYGFNIASSAANGDNLIRKNKIYNIQSTSTSTSLAIRGIYGTIATGGTITIENNFISLPLNNQNATVIGIHLLGTTDYSAFVYYNTVRIAGTHGSGILSGISSAGIFKAFTGDTSLYRQKNNICINERTGGSGVHVGSAIDTGLTVLDVDYNTYFNTNAGAQHAGWGGVFFSDLAAYKTAAGANELHSKFYGATFASMTDLHLSGASVGDNQLAGTPITNITTDIDNETRSMTTPYMGADEGAIPLSGSPQIIVTSPNGGENWLVGATKNITWVSQMVTNAAIKYTTDNGTTWLPVAASVPAATGTYAWTVPNTPSTQCKVRVSDAAVDTIFDISNAAFTIGTQQVLSIPMALAAGWNMVSVPVVATDMTAAALFPGANSSVFAYNNGYVTQTTLTNGAGYWVRYPAAANFNISGTAVQSTTVPLAAGWNMVGVYHTNVPVANITTTPAGIINSLWFTFENGYVQAATLNSGKGYWVRSSAAGVMNLPGPLAKAGEGIVMTPDNTLGKIIISDASGKSSVLYAVKQGEAADMFTLPPVPPAGSFDVRFASQTQAEVLGASFKEITISGAMYPVTITTEGTALRVRDKATNGALFGRVIQAGQSAQIGNEGITAIEVGTTETPASYELSQNYPNPFNPSTTIKYGVGSMEYGVNAVMVSLKVFDVLGAEVKTLVEKYQTAGEYEVEFDAAALKSGVYFYRLQAGTFTATRKFIVMK